MSGKNQSLITFNWQSTNPVTGFLPPPVIYGGGSAPSGVSSGTMSSTNTIYSQILEKSRMDNIGIELAWTGTPTGTISVLVSVSGINFPALTFPINQPAGSAGTTALSLNQLPFKYFMLQYTNASGSGLLMAYGQQQDLN
jgi:hypothetical protein